LSIRFKTEAEFREYVPSDTTTNLSGTPTWRMNDRMLAVCSGSRVSHENEKTETGTFLSWDIDWPAIFAMFRA
jgi:hypothetical protein